MAGIALGIAGYIAATSNLVFAFSDAASHVVIPRRVFDNVDPGLAQLGTHWGPLFHVLQLPLVWIDPLYRSGVSAMVVSMAASLLTVYFVYRLALQIGASRQAAFLAGVLLATSPSFAYSGVVPMLPATIMATCTVNIYYLTRWAYTRSGVDLLLSGIALSAASLTHFDTWILLPLEAAAIAILSLRARGERARTEATILLWLLAGSYGVALFTLMNVMIFEDPLAFTRPFAETGDVFGTSRSGLAALLDYPRAAVAVVGPVGSAVAGAAVAAYLWNHRTQPNAYIPLLLLYPICWYTLQAGTAGSLIEAGGSLGEWRNLRYGITILPAAAFFVATGFQRTALTVPLACAVFLASAMTVPAGTVAAWKDAQHDVPSSDRLADAADAVGGWLDGGKAFIPAHHSLVDRFELFSGLPTRAFIDANDTATWRHARRRAIQDPEALRRAGIDWIVWLGNRERPFVERVIARSGARPCAKWRSVAGSGYLVRVYALKNPAPCHT